MINYTFETITRLFINEQEFKKGEEVKIDTGTRIMKGVLAGFCDEYNMIYLREKDEGYMVGAVRMIPLDAIERIEKI